MAKFPLYQWKKAGEGSSSIDTQNFASKIKANTFTQKNVFKNTGDVVSIQRTDNQSFGVDFKNESGERLAFIGTSQNETSKATVWGVSGLILQTTNSQIDIKSGNQPLLYTSTNNTKNRREVLVRNDLYYIKKADQTAFNISAKDYQTAEYTITGLTTGLNEFYVVLNTNAVKISFSVQIQCNNLSHKNMSEIKTITTTDWSSQNLDQGGLIQIGLMVYGNNKLKWRMKNLHNSQISFTSAQFYHRIPGKISNS